MTKLADRPAERLASRYEKGFGPRTRRRVRLFYLTFPKGSALLSDPGLADKWITPVSKSSVPEIRTALLSKSTTVENAIFPPHLGWIHDLVLMRVENRKARALYEIEAARESWASCELERQVASLLFERFAKSRDRDEVLALARFQHYLPTAEELRAEVTRSREEVEQHLLLEMDDPMPRTPGRRWTRKKGSPSGSKRTDR